MSGILAFFTVAGVNISFWAFISFVRFVFDELENMTPGAVRGEHGRNKSAAYLTRWSGPLTLIILALGCLFLFVLTITVTDLARSVSLPDTHETQVGTLLIMLLWIFYAGLAGYLSKRLHDGSALRTSATAGLILWAALFMIIAGEYFVKGASPDIFFATLASLLLLLFTLSISSSVLGGLLAVVVQDQRKAEERGKKENESITEKEVAALVPAHNEEETLSATIDSLRKILPRKNIFIASDGSTDRTVSMARRAGVQVLDIQPNKGKAGALAFAMQRFDLFEQFKVVLIVDADTRVDASYLCKGLKLFNDPQVAAVAGHANVSWQPHTVPRLSSFFPAYRVRLYRILQMLFRFPQTWKYTNVTTIVPGFASMYRTSALKQIRIDAPGLVIEDFNMTFELHHKKIGRVAYSPEVFAFSHEPVTFSDYVKQVRRWHLGFWQTVRKHGVWASFFWLSLAAFLLELLLYSMVFLAVPFVLLALLLGDIDALPMFSFWGQEISVTLLDVLIGVFLADYALTVAVAFFERKPLLLVYGLGFFVLRYIDMLLFLTTLPAAFFITSDGRWKSPARLQSA